MEKEAVPGPIHLSSRPTDLASMAHAERRAAVLAVVTGVVLMLAKFGAYLITGSAAIFSDALESIVNVVASLVAWYVLKVAHAPPDVDHPYGHGKAEFVSSALEGGMILAAAGAIVFHAVDNLISPALHAEGFGWGLAIIAATMAVNGAVGYYLLRLGKRNGSVTLEGDGHHLLSDAVTSAAGLASLLLVRATGIAQFDPIIAAGMGVYLGFIGARLSRRSLDGLMDRQDEKDQALIDTILKSHAGPVGSPPRICSFHKVRHRHAGRHHWVDFHVQLPASTDVHAAHVVASAIEHEIETALGTADATAHVEPCEDPACERCGTARGPSTPA